MLAPSIQGLSRTFAIRPGEGYRLGVMAALLFLLIAANNLIKILRDSIFLGHHSVSELPYLYILVALFAGVIIATYTKYTSQVSLIRLILASNAIIVAMLAGFWLLLTYFDGAWSHYAFYIWSAMVSIIAVAQLWTLANQLFNPDEGKRLFGLLAAGGTIGGGAAAFAAKWTLHLSVESDHFLWVVGSIYITASLLLFMTRRRLKDLTPDKGGVLTNESANGAGHNVFAHLAASRYLKTIATMIFVSVIVSTLFDFELKTAAKASFPSKSALAVFFSSYYGWLSVATFFSQVMLTGKTLNKLGLGASLYLTPIALLTGAFGIMIWPGLMAPALTRIADAMLRNSIHRSCMEMLYMAVPGRVLKSIKTFLDVVVERVGDASAGFIILLVGFASLGSYRPYVHFICVGLIFLWIALIRFLRSGYAEALRQEALPQEPSLPSGSDAIAQAKHSSRD